MKVAGQKIIVFLILVLLAGFSAADWPSFLEEGYYTPNKVVVDHEGCVYLAGVAGDAGQKTWVARLDSNGTLLWSHIYYKAGSPNTYRDMAVDSHNNVIVTSIEVDEEMGQHWATCKFDKFGTRQWVKREFDWINTAYSFPNAVITDADDSVYVTGMLARTDSLPFVITKYSAEGDRRWQRDEPGFAFSLMGLDPSGNVVVTGRTKNGLDVEAFSYTKWGKRNWISEYPGLGRNQSSPNVLKFDLAGNVVIGMFVRSGNKTLFGVWKLNGNNGVERWVTTWDSGLGGADNFVRDLAIGPNNSVFVLGDAPGKGVVLTRLSESGVIVWRNPFLDLSESGNIGFGADGHLYLAASTGNNNAVVLWKMSHAGLPLTESSYDFAHSKNLLGGMAFSDARDSLFIAGSEVFSDRSTAVPFVVKVATAAAP